MNEPQSEQSNLVIPEGVVESVGLTEAPKVEVATKESLARASKARRLELLKIAKKMKTKRQSRVRNAMAKASRKRNRGQ